MINRYAYTSMTGATAATQQLAVTSNNLANGLTPGFREVISAFRAVPLKLRQEVTLPADKYKPHPIL
jgi:flagellar basal-body rod protein FlgF